MQVGDARSRSGFDAGAFVRRLASARIGSTFNFYRQGEGARLRRERLARYLAARSDARFVLVGEAPGYLGARVCGIPFSSERLLTACGPAEPTATIVWRVLRELELEHDVLCWNAVPTHPHRPGRPASNRPPTAAEVAAGRPFLEQVVDGRCAIAVGRVAASVLPGAPAVRHPSRGGAAAFRSGLLQLLG